MKENKQAGRITSITIENFKGIGAPVTIPLKPITLLFGANSAGKSSILQAITFISNVLKDGRGISLRESNSGKYHEIVHNHDVSVITAADIESELIEIPESTLDQNILERPFIEGFTMESIVRELEKHYVDRAIKETAGNKSKAAKLMGISRPTLDKKL